MLVPCAWPKCTLQGLAATLALALTAATPVDQMRARRALNGPPSGQHNACQVS